MGGRGSKSNLQPRPASPPAPKLTPGFEFLGEKGDPHDMDTARQTSNPNYFKGREWQQNCQRCIYAYEMQRRGYDVEAKPRIFDGTDRLPYMNDRQGWLQVMENPQVTDFTSRNTIRQLAEKMAEFGDGARAIVRVVWKGRRSGHVFMAEQSGGGTIFVDPQTGQHVDIHHYMNEAIKGETKLIRVDNLRPTQLLEKCVKRRGT